MAGEDYNEQMRREAALARNAEHVRNAKAKKAREELQAARTAARRSTRAEAKAAREMEAGDIRRAAQRVADQKVIDANEERRKSIKEKRLRIKKTQDALSSVDSNTHKQLKNIKKLPPAERKKAAQNINKAAAKTKRDIKRGK